MSRSSMPTKLRAIAAAAALLACTTAAGFALPTPPPAPRIDVTDTYFGTRVVDPYRWMEAGGPDLLAYLEAHSRRTRAILDAIPGRGALAARLHDLSETSDASFDVVARHGSYFYQKLPPGADAVKLYVRSRGVERVLVDPETLPGPRQALAYFAVSNDGARVAYGLSAGGSENGVVHVVDVRSGTTLPDRIEGADFGVTCWSDDGSAFYYLRRQSGAPRAARYMNLRSYRHVVGEPASADVAVFGAHVNRRVSMPPTAFATLGVSPESAYASGVVMNGADPFAAVYVAPKTALDEPAAIPWRRIIGAADKVMSAGIHGETVYALTAKNAPRFKLVAFDLVRGSIATATEIVPAGKRVIDGFSTAADAVYVSSRENGLARVTRIGYDGSRREVPLPGGAISALTTEYDRPGFLAQFTSWTAAPLWYAFDVRTGELVDTRLDRPSPVSFSTIRTDEVMVPAADGTPIPLSILRRRDLKLDGSNPALLYGYGAYGIPLSPFFSAARMAWLERGGIFAVAHLRGGGEYGEEWHLAGKGANKVKTISDYIDCARWLEANGYTSPTRLAGRGGSAGGIAIGGAIAKAPQLFAAMVLENPLADQLRVETTPNGPPNVPEFGSVRTPRGFANLYATSPVHNLVAGSAYPAVLVTTGINDARVDPWQAAKLAATLQATSASGKPILLRVDYEGGHGSIGSGRAQSLSLMADEYAFLMWQLRVPGFEPSP